MDKKIHKITEKIQRAEKDIKENKPKMAKMTLKKAAKDNEKLKRIDRDVRDPEIEAYKKMKKKGC